MRIKWHIHEWKKSNLLHINSQIMSHLGKRDVNYKGVNALYDGLKITLKKSISKFFLVLSSLLNCFSITN
jgi:hypothetical protein